MRSRSSVRVRLVGGFVVLMFVGVFLGLASILPVAPSSASSWVEPMPVPTPPPAEPRASSVDPAVAQRPAPVPVPTPPASPPSPQGQANEASTLALFALPVLAAGGLAVFWLRLDLPAERTAYGARRVTTACQECGS